MKESISSVSGEEYCRALREISDLKTKLAYADDAAAKGEQGRTLGTALEGCQEELKEAKEKLDYVTKMGLKFGIMKTSNKPEGFLAHVWDENSDHERMFNEWSHSIGWETQVARLTKERDDYLETLAAIYDKLGLTEQNTTGTQKVSDTVKGIVDRLTNERDEVKNILINLLCRIHRDGGHYINDHGFAKACKDADMKVATLNADSDTDLNKELQATREILEVVRKKHDEANRLINEHVACACVQAQELITLRRTLGELQRFNGSF